MEGWELNTNFQREHSDEVGSKAGRGVEVLH